VFTAFGLRLFIYLYIIHLFTKLNSKMLFWAFFRILIFPHLHFSSFLFLFIVNCKINGLITSAVLWFAYWAQREWFSYHVCLSLGGYIWFWLQINLSLLEWLKFQTNHRKPRPYLLMTWNSSRIFHHRTIKIITTSTYVIPGPAQTEVQTAHLVHFA
jgi:hypothetical protein